MKISQNFVFIAANANYQQELINQQLSAAQAGQPQQYQYKMSESQAARAKAAAAADAANGPVADDFIENLGKIRRMIGFCRRIITFLNFLSHSQPTNADAAGYAYHRTWPKSPRSTRPYKSSKEYYGEGVCKKVNN